MTTITEAMRRVITGDDPSGQSVVIIDGGPSSAAGQPDIGGLFEIWEDAASGPLDPKVHDDLGTTTPVLGPRSGNVQVRWFVIPPTDETIPKAERDAATRERFKAFGGEHHIVDQTRHSGMHKTHSIDVICLLQGEATLILDKEERRLKPGQVVIQRGTAHAWEAHGGPALLLAVLIDRPLTGV
jgi:mannose-6-phosphate isomerase-like protein (cupin superfamily)